MQNLVCHSVVEPLPTLLSLSNGSDCDPDPRFSQVGRNSFSRLESMLRLQVLDTSDCYLYGAVQRLGLVSIYSHAFRFFVVFILDSSPSLHSDWAIQLLLLLFFSTTQDKPLGLSQSRSSGPVTIYINMAPSHSAKGSTRVDLPILQDAPLDHHTRLSMTGGESPAKLAARPGQLAAVVTLWCFTVGFDISHTLSVVTELSLSMNHR